MLCTASFVHQSSFRIHQCTKYFLTVICIMYMYSTCNISCLPELIWSYWELPFNEVMWWSLWYFSATVYVILWLHQSSVSCIMVASNYHPLSFPLISFNTDTPPPEQQELVVKKLEQCCMVFDFMDAVSELRGKEIKRASLNELVDYITTGRGVLTEPLYPECIRMVSISMVFLSFKFKWSHQITLISKHTNAIGFSVFWLILSP